MNDQNMNEGVVWNMINICTINDISYFLPTMSLSLMIEQNQWKKKWYESQFDGNWHSLFNDWKEIINSCVKVRNIFSFFFVGIVWGSSFFGHKLYHSWKHMLGN